MLFLVGLLLISSAAFVSSVPVDETSEIAEVAEPAVIQPFKYSYTVKDPEKQLFFEKTESGDDKGKVTGSYSVLLADGRLMTVEYVADASEGFVPKITWDSVDPPFASDADNVVK